MKLIYFKESDIDTFQQFFFKIYNALVFDEPLEKIIICNSIGEVEVSGIEKEIFLKYYWVVLYDSLHYNLDYAKNILKTFEDE